MPKQLIADEELVELGADDLTEARFIQDQEVPLDDLPDIYGDMKVKQVIRTIAKDNFTRQDLSAVAVEEIDAYLSLYIQRGFKLFDTHFIGLIPEGYAVLYILTRD